MHSRTALKKKLESALAQYMKLEKAHDDAFAGYEQMQSSRCLLDIESPDFRKIDTAPDAKGISLGGIGTNRDGSVQILTKEDILDDNPSAVYGEAFKNIARQHGNLMAACYINTQIMKHMSSVLPNGRFSDVDESGGVSMDVSTGSRVKRSADNVANMLNEVMNSAKKQSIALGDLDARIPNLVTAR